MSNRKFVELVSGKNHQELVELYVSLKREYMNLRMAIHSQAGEIKGSTIKTCRKNVARVKTRLRQLRNNNQEDMRYGS